MASQTGSPRKFVGKVLSVVLCVALLGTTYAGFFRGLDAAASAVDLNALQSGEVGVNKGVSQWTNPDGTLGRGADITVNTAAIDAATNAVYDDIIPDYAEVVANSIVASMGTASVLSGQQVTINGKVCTRDIVRWNIGTIPSTVQSLKYSIRVKDASAYGILDVSEQGILKFTKTSNGKTDSPLVVQIDELILAPKGADDYYTVNQQESLKGNVKYNDDPLNKLVDRSGNSSDAKTTVNGYPAGLEGDVDKAHLSPYTVELVDGAKNGTVNLNGDGSFTYIQSPDLVSKEIQNFSDDPNGTDAYNAVKAGWQDSFTYKLHTNGYSTKYIYETIAHTTYNTYTVEEGMSFKDVNSVAGDKFCMLIFENVNQTGADSEGRVIIGGDLNITGGWTVSGNTNFGDDYALLVGGTIYGGYTCNSGRVSQGEQWVRDYVARAREAFTDLSKKYSELPADGNSARNPYYTAEVLLTADPNHQKGKPHVFFIDGNEYAQQVKFVGNFGDDQIIVNVSGTNISISGGQWAMTDGDMNEAKLSNQTTWNFYQAQKIETSSFSFKGSVLAPYADFKGTNGHVEGTLICKSATGAGGYEYHAKYFFFDTTGSSKTYTEEITTYETKVTEVPISLTEYGMHTVNRDAEKDLESKIITAYIRIAPKFGDINASKNSNPAPGTTVMSGDTIEYTVTASNPGAVAINDVVITDVLPLGTSLIDGSISDGGSIDANGKISWNVNLAANGSKTVSFKVRVNDSVTGKGNLSNVALVTFTIPGNPPTTTSTNVVNHAYISAVKTSSGQGRLVKIGEQIIYTVTVTNNGSAPAYDVQVVDEIPEGLTLASAGDFTANGNKLSTVISSVNPGESKAVSFSVTVDEFETGTRVFKNTAAVNGTPTNETTDTSKRGDVVVYYREVGTEKELAPSTGAQGGFGENYGPYTPVDIPDYRFVNVVGSTTGTYIEGTITIIFYYEKVPASAIVKYVDESYNEIDAPVTYNGYVGETLEDLYGKKDTIGNYTYVRTEADTYTLTEEGIVITHVYKLNVDDTVPTVLKSSEPAPNTLVKVGEYITYTISVTNNKYEAMNDVVVSDNAPKGTKIVAADGAVVSGDNAQWTIPTIEAGATAKVSFTVVVDSNLAESGNLSNVATVKYYDRDATTPTELTTNVVNHAVLTAVKYTGSNERGYYGVGDTINYFIKVKNVGSADAANIKVTDSVPAGTTLASGDTSWTFSLKAGAEKVVSFAVTINDIDAYNAVINNTAYVNDTPTNTTEDIVKKGDVIVKYQDEEGNPLHEDTYYVGTPGDDHGDTSWIEIPNYTYKTTEGTTTGKFIEGRITIIHIYTKTPAACIVKYLDIDTLAPIDASQTMTGFAGEPIESDLWHEIENWKYIKTDKPEMVFVAEGSEIIHYYRFIKPDDTKPSLVKESDPASGTEVRPGETVTYNITFTNTRIDTINDVVISDVLPTGSTLIEGSISDDGYLQNRTVKWNIGTLESGQSKKVSFAVIVNKELTGYGNMANTATATFTDRDRNPEEPISSNTTKHPIILASKDHSNDQPDAILTEGDKITYTITVKNVGSETAINVPVTDKVPAGTYFHSSPDMIYGEGSVSATIPELVPGTPVTLSFTVVIDKFANEVYAENIPNSAKVGDQFTNEVDDVAKIGYVLVRHWDYDGTLLDNFTVSKSGRVGTSYGAYTDLVSTKQIENRYLTKVVGNTTGNYIPGLVTIDFYYDRIPVTLTVKYLEKGTNVPVKVTENYDGFYLGEAIPSKYTEKVDVTGYNYDSVNYPDNMIFDEENEVIIHYYVRILDTDKPEIVKSASPASGSTVIEGNNITYSITVKNPRTTDALEETVVSDPLPLGTTFVSADNGGEYDADSNSVVWNVGSIPAGKSKTVNFKVKVNTGITSGINLANQAFVSYRDIQTNQTNTVPSNITTHGLLYSVKKSSNEPGNILTDGSLITYTITTKNVGSAPADVTIVDAVPANSVLYSETLTEGATVTGGVITYKVSALEPEATATLTFTVKVNMGKAFTVDIKNKATVNDIPTNETTDRAQRGTVHTRYFLVEPDGTSEEVTDYDNGIGYRNEGEVGKPLDVPENKTFDNYELFKITKSSDSETYIPGDIEICYYFTRVPVTVTILYKDIDTLATIADTKYFGFDEAKYYAGDVFPSIYKQDITHYSYVKNDAPTKTVVDEYGNSNDVPDLLLPEDGLVITHYYKYIVDSTEIVRVKSSDPVSGSTVKPGQEITYTINVENPRYDDLNNVVVTDAIPAGTKLVDGTVSGNGTASNGVITWNIGTMEAKSNVNLSFTVKVDNDFTNAGNLENQAVVNYADSKGEPQNPVYTNKVNHSVLKFSKAVSKTEANVGDELTYTIKVMNYGSEVAEQVVIADALPAGTSLVPGSISDGGKLTADGVVTWTAAQVPVGVETSFSFKVKIEAPAAGIYNEKIVNTATVNDEPTNTTETTVTLGTVTVIHIDDQGNVLIPKETHTGNVGDEFAFSPFDDSVIYGYNHIKTTIDNKEINTPDAKGNLIEGNIDVVFVYQKGEGVLTVRYLEKGTNETLYPAYTEVFEIGTKVTDLHVVDLLPYYERVDEDTVYNPEDLIISRDGVEIIYYYVDIPDTTEIVRSKVSDPEQGTILLPGDEVTYTVYVENPRREKIDNIVVSDPIPAGTEIVEDSISNDGYVLDGVVYWNIDSLAIGANATFTFTVKVNQEFETAGNVENTAFVTFTNRKDTEPTTYPTNTVKHPVLVSKKEVDKTEANVGEEFTYTISVTNYGSIDAVNVQITDELPEGLTLVKENKPAYTVEDNVLTWNINKLGVGETETYTFIVMAEALDEDTYRTVFTNVAKVNGKETNPVDTTVTCGTVTIVHVDEEGRTVLIEKKVITDKVGTPYKFEPAEIDGYVYKETEGEPEGEIVEGVTDVVMIYKKGEATLTVRYLDEDTKEVIHDSYTETMFVGDEVKDEHKEDIENYTYTKTDKPDSMIMTKDGIEIIHYYKHTPPTYTVEGKAWSTENTNSKWDTSDKPYGNLPVYLKDSSGKVVDNCTTDKDGNFKFEDVLAGNYKVEYSVPTGYEVASPLPYNPSQLNSVVSGSGSTPVTVDKDVKNIGMELYKTKVLGASDTTPVTTPEPIQTYTNKVETVKVYQPVEPSAEKASYTKVLGDSDTPHTGDDSYGATVAMILASASLFVLILCRKNK